MFYGWADPALNAMMGVEYYESVLAKMGPSTQEFFRLFMLPGVFHCGGGVGCGSFDRLTPLMDWVEKGKAPLGWWRRAWRRTKCCEPDRFARIPRSPVTRLRQHRRRREFHLRRAELSATAVCRGLRPSGLFRRLAAEAVYLLVQVHRDADVVGDNAACRPRRNRGRRAAHRRSRAPHSSCGTASGASTK
jgi:hypothetical protein